MLGEKVNPLPNILTTIRLVSGLVMFLLLAGAAGGIPVLSATLSPDDQFALQRWAVIAFVLAALTDFFDGYLARKLHAESEWGAILDPIADKILICGSIIGIFAQSGADAVMALPCAIILFREFAVSALRESMAPRGIKLPVTTLAKWKTTLQLVALGLQLIVTCWASFDLPLDSITLFGFEAPMVSIAADTAFGLLWIAALVTAWTGYQYFVAASEAVQGHQN